MAEPEDFDYLLEEMRLLNSLRLNATQQSESRVNIFFLVVTGIAAVAAWIARDHTFSEDFFIALVLINIVLLILGILSFLRLLEAHFSIVTYTRGINRIRAYFLEKGSDVEISKALLLPANDDHPPFGGFGFGKSKAYRLGLTGIMVVLNAALVASLISIVLGLLLRLSILALIGIGILVFLLAIILMNLYASRRSAEKERQFADEHGVKFPAKENGPDVQEQEPVPGD